MVSYLPPRAAESAGAAFCFVEYANAFAMYLSLFKEEHLADSIAFFVMDRMVGQVDQTHDELPQIGLIDDPTKH